MIRCLRNKHEFAIDETVGTTRQNFGFASFLMSQPLVSPDAAADCRKGSVLWATVRSVDRLLHHNDMSEFHYVISPHQAAATPQKHSLASYRLQRPLMTHSGQPSNQATLSPENRMFMGSSAIWRYRHVQFVGIALNVVAFQDA